MSESSVWKFFIVKDGDDSKSVCKSCDTEISRGSKLAKAKTTSAMRKHLKTRHPLLHAQLEEMISAEPQSQSKAPKPSRQQTLTECLTYVKEWTPESSNAERIHKSIATMMAKDLQPYSIVEDEGFKRLVHDLEPR